MLVLVASAAVVVGVSTSAFADSAGTAGDQFILAQLQKYGVPAAQQATLLAKYHQGLPFDSGTPGALPVSESQYISGGLSYDVKRYADGSYAAQAIQVAQATTSAQRVTPQGTNPVNGCSTTSSQGVAITNGCLVKVDQPTLTEQFRADFSRVPSQSRISRIYDWDIQGAAGACTKYSFSITEAVGTPSYPATAQLRAYCVGYTGIASAYPYLQLNVRPTGYNMTTNW